MSSHHREETPLSSGTRDGNAQLASLPQTDSEPTPVMKKQAGHAPCSEVPKDLNKIRIPLALDMTGRWVGPMPVNDFLDEFLPVASASGQGPSLPEDPFQQMLTQSSESNRYTPFIRTIEGWMPGFVAVNASNRADADKKLKPDVSIYRAGVGDQVPSRTNFSQMELWVAFKGNARELPFQDPEQPSPDVSDEQTTFTPETKHARMARGQLISYAVTHHARQFRHSSFSFSIFIADNHARFLRWDQVGTIVTAAFDFREHPDIMASFLWRFSHLSDAQRGYDMSVRPADLTSDVARRVRKGLALDSAETPLFEYDLPGLSGKGRGYGPFPSSSYPLVSRCTRTLPIFFIPDQGTQYEDVTTHAEPGIPPSSEEASPWEREGVVFLKDAWLFLSNDPDTNMMREHEIYELLHEKKTPNIPKHVAGGDVPGGMTQTQDFRDADWLCVTVKVKPSQHYRLVLGVVGRPLTKFKCTKELVQAIYDAMQAHWHAYEMVLILHRDISVGNILITADGHGLLIDWEMGKLLDEVGSQQYDRAGTMQFMSAALLMDDHKMHTLTDDIESFIHVIGWLILRLVPSTEDFYPGYRAYNYREMFDGAHYQAKFAACICGERKAVVLGAGMYPGRRFEFKQPTPLSHLLLTLCKPFKSWYSADSPTDEDRFKLSEPPSPLEDELTFMWRRLMIKEYDQAAERLKSSTWFISTIGAALAKAGWPEDDAADETVYPPSTELMTEQPRTNRLLTSQNQFATSKGSSGGSTRKRRAASPTPEPSAKRRRGC